MPTTTLLGFLASLVHAEARFFGCRLAYSDFGRYDPILGEVTVPSEQPDVYVRRDILAAAGHL
jgi:hypothetical protein